jgi:REP element-mobilizing transposase RayT
MADTFSQIYIHLVFSVKGRQNIIHKTWREELFRYVSGIINGRDQKLFAIGGMPDHIHILISLRPNCMVSELVNSVKTNSSKWINSKGFVKGKFYWQEGYGAFSYGQSQLDHVIQYINNQESHHLRRSFKEEYIELLEKFNVKFDEKYLFDWVD